MAVSVRINWKDELGPLLDKIVGGQKVEQALRASVNRAAFESKRDFAKAVKPDAAGPGITVAVVRKNMSPTVRARVGKLTAAFTVSNSPWKRSPKVLALKKGNQHREGGATISTFAISGGPSSNLTKRGFFRIEKNGGRVILIRHSSAAGRKRGYAGKMATKAIYAEAPATALKYVTNQPSRVWKATAASSLRANIEKRLGSVLRGGSPGPDVTGD